MQYRLRAAEAPEHECGVPVHGAVARTDPHEDDEVAVVDTQDARAARARAAARLDELTQPVEAALESALDEIETTLQEITDHPSARDRRGRGLDLSRRLARLEREIGPPGVEHLVADFGVDL
jgi:hypothetical protein